MDNNEILEQLVPPQRSTPDTLICVIDRSGSMNGILEEAQNGLNNFINSQREMDTLVTLIEFDDEIRTVYDQADIKEVGEYKLKPRNFTALYDAIGKACNIKTASEKVIVLIITDGAENASKEFNSNRLANMIAEREEQGWEFLFMGANQDAVLAGGSFGMNAARSINYTADEKGVGAMYSAATTYVNNSRLRGVDAAVDFLADLGNNASSINNAE